MNKPCAIILAAGNSLRLRERTGGIAKQFISYKGIPLYMHSVELFRKIPYIDLVIITLPKENLHEEKSRIEKYSQQYGFPCIPTCGGSTRAESMKKALYILPKTCQTVYIHDAARPFASTHLIHTLYEFLESHNDSKGVIPVLTVTDTIKIVQDGKIISTPDRSCLFRAQTPQYFRYRSLMESINEVTDVSFMTDDASFLEHCNLTVHTIPGEEKNIKITSPEDLSFLEEKKVPLIKTTMGYDVHAYDITGRDYILGGIRIDTPEKIRAHSDGDVVLHALIDALLACTDKGDIGTCFPDTDAMYEGISSALLLHEVLEITKINGISIQHVDITIVAQVPKLKQYMDKIKKNIAYLLNIQRECVSIKATTEEYLGFTGKKEGVKAYVLVTTQSI